MQVEVINMIKLFLEFLRSFDAWHVHNMMIIMLDPCFNFLYIVKIFVECGNAI